MTALIPILDELPRRTRTFMEEVLVQIRKINVLYKTQKGREPLYYSADFNVRQVDCYPCGCRPALGQSIHWRINHRGEFWHLGCRASNRVISLLPTDRPEYLRLVQLPTVRRPK
jgi:hypothetical protein